MSRNELSFFRRGPRILNNHFTVDPNEFVLWNLSYSMHGEDLILRSMLKERLKSDVPGFYVDIGGFDPRYGSNSYLFYRYGWCGICVEVNPEFADHWTAVRPRDTFINAAIGEAGIGYWALNKNGAAASEVSRSRDAFGPECHEPVELSFLPLRTLFEEHVPPQTEIEFMSIDIEGSELSALKSNDWSRFRPKIILIEVNHIGSPTIDASNFEQAETIIYLKELGYRAVGVMFPNAILVDG